MKKLNKFFAVLVALAMMATLCVMSAFAEGETTTVPTGTAGNSYLVKYLEIKEGVTIPADTFKFIFTGKNASDNTISAAEADAVAPQNVSISARDMETSGSDLDGGNLVDQILIAPLFKDANNKYKFTKPGVYTYLVTEEIQKTSDGTYADNTQGYILRVYVIDDGQGGYTIDKVTIATTTYTPGTPGTDDTPGTPGTYEEDAKGNPTITDPSVDTKGTEGTEDDEDRTESQVEGGLEGFTFLNKYTQAGSETPTPDPAHDKFGAFDTSKTVLGQYGDKTADFPFTVSVEFPSTFNGKKELTMYKMDKENATAESVAANTTEACVLALNATTGKYEGTFTLKDGQVAYFKNLPADTKVVVTETLADSSIVNKGSYMEKSAFTDNGQLDATKATRGNIKTENDKEVSNGTAVNLAASELTYTDAKAKAKNAEDFTNESDYEPSTTGILINNLPYIVLALVAVGGMVAYVVIRRRDSEEA